MPAKVHPEIREKIADWASKGYGAKEIETYLAQLKANGKLPALVPHYKTIGRYVRLYRPPAPPTPEDAWPPPTVSSEEAALVTPVLAEVIAVTEGRVTVFTHALASWVAYVRRLAPDIPLWDAYQIASEYERGAGAQSPHEQLGAIPKHVLDTYLVLRPWTAEGAARWAALVESGRLSLFPKGLFQAIWKEKTEEVQHGDTATRTG